MKESYECELATHIGPESCGAAREGGVEALIGERAGRVFSRVRQSLRDRRCWPTFTCTTCSTFGSKRGVESRRTATSSSCVLQPVLWLDSRARRRPTSFGRN